ncbi:hypothetical protein D3C72_1180900 [compost metagenome]
MVALTVSGSVTSAIPRSSRGGMPVRGTSFTPSPACLAAVAGTSATPSPLSTSARMDGTCTASCAMGGWMPASWNAIIVIEYMAGTKVRE